LLQSTSRPKKDSTSAIQKVSNLLKSQNKGQAKAPKDGDTIKRDFSQAFDTRASNPIHVNNLKIEEGYHAAGHGANHEEEKVPIRNDESFSLAFDDRQGEADAVDRNVTMKTVESNNLFHLSVKNPP